MMGKLICFELHKLFRKKSLYICSALIMVSLLLPPFLFEEFSFRGMAWVDLLTSSLSDSLVSGLIPILIPILVCEDYNTGSLKSEVGRGYRRGAVFFAKFFTTAFASLLLCMVCWITVAVAGALLLNGAIYLNSRLLSTLGAQLLLTIASSALCFSASILSRSTAVGILFGVLGPRTVDTLLRLADHKLKLSVPLSRYWISSLNESLYTLPADSQPINGALLFGTVYILSFLLFGLIWFRRKDI